jgi:hypothetical protein
VTLKNVIFSLKAHSTTHQKGRLGNWERKIENYLRGRLVFSLGKAATQMRGSKVMLTVRVRLQFNYLYLEDFCNLPRWLACPIYIEIKLKGLLEM